MSSSKVLVVGGGPAGSIAALALIKLGHSVSVYERFHHPRYRIGESLLPGTMSILARLGLKPQIDAAGFVRKPSATFLWGVDQAPWTFSFSVPQVSGWIYDHALQVKRDEFDAMLLEEVKRRGGEVKQDCSVTDIRADHPDHVEIDIDDADGLRSVSGDYLVDASGSDSILVNKLGCRNYDEFYRSLAVWSYFRCPDPFRGDLRGTTYSITFEHGWCWMIPLKGDVYSVGVIVDQSKAEEIRNEGLDNFYQRTLSACRGAKALLGTAKRVDEVRVVRDWSYDTSIHSRGRFFLVGDSACFTDPLFSQGVHLAAQSAVSAAAGIDRISRYPNEADDVHRWYGKSYSLTFEQYHEFLASFYNFASFTEPESEFWNKRRIAEPDDQRFERRNWFENLVKDSQKADWKIEDFRDRASTMIAIGRHSRQDLSSDFSDAELVPRRIEWVSQLTKKLNSVTKLVWIGHDVRLETYYKVDPEDFTLKPRLILANEAGKVMTKYAVEPAVGAIFRKLASEEIGYRTLIKLLSDAGCAENSSQIVVRLFEAGLLTGYDSSGLQVHIQDRLRFDGVGVDYEV
ncbi:chloramphenicol-biosynthetic FADH2-dependent halogenase CmlS [Bradyrhizobium sp. STM 3562]|uniref:chloramphenicol-biosynthetic FADH2-dependent halogenase CmlS n=1 Tax=Bradyrhizobium sp. STM 3562 TaxID=578924 RepID=UPI00389025D0